MVNIVLREGATSCGNPEIGACEPCPSGTGYRDLTLNRDRGTGWRSVGAGTRTRTILSTISDMCVYGE